MYYLHGRGRNAHPTPAEAPYVCNANGRHEWKYGLKRHRIALQNTKAEVDPAPPDCYDPAQERAKVYTRRFVGDLKRAEIGRENRKLCERLDVIARGAETGYDPRAPPRRNSSHVPTYKRGASLIESGRRKSQMVIDKENTELVKRILNAKCSFDRARDAEHFQTHQRASWIMQRLPAESLKSRSCPRLGHSALVSRFSSPVLQGLDMLIVPGSLQRGLAWTAPNLSSETPVAALTDLYQCSASPPAASQSHRSVHGLGSELPVSRGSERPVSRGSEWPISSGSSRPVSRGREMNTSTRPVSRGSSRPVSRGCKTPEQNSRVKSAGSAGGEGGTDNPAHSEGKQDFDDEREEDDRNSSSKSRSGSESTGRFPKTPTRDSPSPDIGVAPLEDRTSAREASSPDVGGSPLEAPEGPDRDEDEKSNHQDGDVLGNTAGSRMGQTGLSAETYKSSEFDDAGSDEENGSYDDVGDGDGSESRSSSRSSGSRSRSRSVSEGDG